LLSFVTVNFPVRHPEALQQPHRTIHRGLRPEGNRAPFLLLLQCLTAAVALGQVRISEFLASNAQSHPDIVDFTDYPDWIELENTTDQPVSLGGWYLSDDPARPLRWAFPSTAVIPAHGFLLVWADGKDAIPGQTHPRGYWPWRSFVTEGYHANFSLSAAGESIVLSRSGSAVSSQLITPGTPKPPPTLEAARWRYLDDGSNPGTAWRSRTFDDVSWKSGPAPWDTVTETRPRRLDPDPASTTDSSQPISATRSPSRIPSRSQR
jgi:Lamin Tail Domain